MTWTRLASGAEVRQQTVVAVKTGGEEIALYWIDGAVSACPGESLPPDLIRGWMPVRRQGHAPFQESLSFPRFN